jgi:hypothetical protein
VQAAWGAAGYAEFISEQLDGMPADYEKRQAEGRELEEHIKTLENAAARIRRIIGT